MTVSEDLAAALAELVALDVEGIKGYRGDRVGQLQLPAFIVGAPQLAGDTFCNGQIDNATFPVNVLARLDGTALDVLFKYAPPVWEAIEEHTAAVVTGAAPTSFDLGNGMTVAAYELTVEYPLG